MMPFSTSTTLTPPFHLACSEPANFSSVAGNGDGKDSGGGEGGSQCNQTKTQVVHEYERINGSSSSMWKPTAAEAYDQHQGPDPDAAAGAARSLIALTSQEVQPLQPKHKPSQETKEEAMPKHPFYHYKDYSREEDPDPLSPLTPPGRVPTFPAKLHAILSRSELEGIITWLPHGRAFTILRPREFEASVIPKYFGHAKMSSFIRQINGWGFRRITQGRDRNAYYHEKFLRGLPHLCKTLKRLGKNAKDKVQPQLEPDLGAISQLYPVPEYMDDETFEQMTCIMGLSGPNARMPVYAAGFMKGKETPVSSVPPRSRGPSISSECSPPSVTPVPETPFDRCHSPPKTVETATATAAMTTAKELHQEQQQQQSAINTFVPSAASMMASMMMSMMSSMPSTAAVAGNAANTSTAHTQSQDNNPQQQQQMFYQAQFAAGFAAATAFSQQHFQTMMQSMAQGDNHNNVNAYSNGMALPQETPNPSAAATTTTRNDSTVAAWSSLPFGNVADKGRDALPKTSSREYYY